MTRHRFISALLAIALLGSIVGAPVAAQAGSPVAESTEQRAELAVDVPNYIDSSVSEDRSGNITVYKLPHGEASIKPANFDAEDVKTYGIEEDNATMEYDDEFDLYRFNSGGTEGSFTVYWVVEETVQVEQTSGNETTLEEKTVQKRYTAVIQVTDHEDRALIGAGKLEDMRQDAESWRVWESDLEGIFGPDVDVDSRTDQAVSWFKTYTNPIASIFGQPGSMLFMLFMTRDGRAILVLFLVLHIFSRREDIKYVLQRDSTKPDEHDAREDLAELDKEDRKRSLQNEDWQDISEHDDRTARSYREWMGDNPHDGGRRLLKLMLPETLTNNRLVAMGHNGWVGTVERADTRMATDGGVAAASGSDGTSPVTDVGVELEADVDEDTETVDLTEPPEWFIEELGHSNPDVLRFDYVNAEVPDNDGAKLDDLDNEELARRLHVQTEDFETDEEWMQLFVEFIAHVRQHGYTNEDGTPKTAHVVLNEFLRTSQLFSDRYEWPAFELVKEAVERAIADQDTMAEAEDLLDQVEANAGVN